MIILADRKADEGLMLITTGTAISNVPGPSVASSPVRETCPKLNWNVCAAENQYTTFIALIEKNLYQEKVLGMVSFICRQCFEGALSAKGCRNMTLKNIFSCSLLSLNRTLIG